MVPPRRRWLRWTLIALAVLVLLPAAGLAVLVWRFDPDALKPRIIAAVEQATGRRLTLAGPIGLKLSLVPTVTLEDVSFANLPGGSRPEMATARRVELRLAVPPLLSRRVEVRRLLLVAPDILLESDAEGRPNWVFAPAAQPADPAPSTEPPAAAPGEAGRPLGIAVDHVAVTEGRLAYRGRGGRTRTLAIERFDAVGDGEAGTLRLDGAFRLDDLPFTLGGETGPLAGLLAPGGAPWPLRLVVAAEGAQATVEGAVGEPLRRRGIDLAVTAQVADLSRHAAMLPDVPLLPLREVEVAFRLGDGTGARPVVSDLRLAVGNSDLNPVLPGLRLERLAIGLPSEDGTLMLEVTAAVGVVPLRLSGSTGSPLRLLPGNAGPPFLVDLAFAAGSASGSVKGSIRDPVGGGIGMDLALAATVPDLAALAPLAGRPLPAVRDIALASKVTERGRGFAAGAILTGLSVASSAGDLAGDLTYVIGQRQGLVGRLASRRLDLDALLPPPAAATPAPAPAVPAARPADDRRVIPDLPLPLEAIRVTDSDLHWTAAEVMAGGTVLREVEAALAIQDGRARLDPFAATLPGGRVTLRAAADVTVAPPTVQVAVRGDGLDLDALLTALRQPGAAQGRLDLDLDLRGQGRDLRAVAATAVGHLGVAMVQGRLAAKLLEALPAEARRLLPGVAGQDIALRCLALRLDAEAGLARSRALLVETAIGKLGGEGGVNLRDETLAFRLLPDLRLSGVALRAPVNVAGTLAAPRVGVSREAAVAGGLAALLSLQRTPDRGLQELAGALGGNAALPECGPQLALARGGRAGPVPEAAAPAPVEAPAAVAPAVPGVPPESQGPAQELLRGLFGRGR